MCIPLKPVFSRHEGDEVQITAEPTGALDSGSARALLTQMARMNERENATILMVTHDCFSASYCRRILFIKDGRIFEELIRGREERREFYDRILEVVSLLGGDPDDEL